MRKILIVEDNPIDAKNLQETLARENYQTITAGDGKTAFQMMEKENPDMVILDILLPDTDGFEVCRQIRKNDRFINIPVLFYSVIKTIDDKLLGLEMGASDFLSKSSEKRELLARIKNLLQEKDKIEQALMSKFFDPLTSLYSGEYFQHRVDDECVRSKRYKHDFACMLIDVDNFGKVNNTFGTKTGDRILKKIGEIVKTNTRDADEICRYKEDEFGILLPETDLRQAYSVAERIRLFMNNTHALRNECTMEVTISCGVSSFFSSTYENDKSQIISLANQAVRLAKKEGRNQTQFCNRK